MKLSAQILGELFCRVVSPDDETEPVEGVVILCHGFGAPGDDLLPLAGEIVRTEPTLADHTLFVFPEAPLALPEVPGGRAWWPIDMLQLQMAIQQGTFRDLRQDVPELLPSVRAKLLAVITELRERTGLPLSKFILGGFSQGSMLAIDVGLRLEDAPGALLVFSGTLLCEPEWKRLAPRRAGLHVLQSHGTMDPLLPYEAALWLRDMLRAAGLDVKFLPFEGMHMIPAEAVDAAARLLRTILRPER